MKSGMFITGEGFSNWKCGGGDFSKHLTNIHLWIKVISMIISHHFPFYYFQNVYVLMFYGERDHMWTQIYAKAKSIFISHCVRLNQISKHVPPCFPYFLPHTYRWYIAGVDFLPQFFPGCLFIPPKWLAIICRLFSRGPYIFLKALHVLAL